MKILWTSNGPGYPTGYGEQTRINVPRINKHYPTTIAAFCGVEGSPIGWVDGITILPKLQDAFLNDVIQAHFNHSGADVALSLLDPWVLDPSVWGRLPWYPWVPLDCTPMMPGNAGILRYTHGLIAMSRFGEEQLKAAGFQNVFYVPHGIETDIFKPVDRAEARRKLSSVWNVDLTGKFLVISNVANKGRPSRKNFDATFQAWQPFAEAHPDAMLYLHTEKNGIWDGEHLPTMIRTLGIDETRVIFPSQYQYLMGMLPPEYLNDVYNAGDVYLTTSRGEGFGIPIVEAQAAGCPVIVGDFTAMPELCFGGWKVPGIPVSFVPGSYQFLVHVPLVLEALENAYSEHKSGAILARRLTSRLGALAYDADRVFEAHWKPTLEAIQRQLGLAEIKEKAA